MIVLLQSERKLRCFFLNNEKDGWSVLRLYLCENYRVISQLLCFSKDKLVVVNSFEYVVNTITQGHNEVCSRFY